MLPGDLNREDPSHYNNKFNENRERIKRLFENNTLKHLITEFYEVQRNFHLNINKLVTGFFKISAVTPKERKYILFDLLGPYRILAKSLFHAPTGDVERDIQHIISVINGSNESFKEAIFALLNSVANVNAFQCVLKECQQDEKIANILKTHCGSDMYIQGYIDLPFQHLMRYELLLKSIKKVLTDGGSMPLFKIGDDVESSLGYLIPEIQNINEYKEVILLLNKIERALLNVLADVTLQEGVASLATGDQTMLRNQIEMVMATLKNGKLNIISGSQQVPSFYDGVLELLKGIEENFKHPQAGASNPVVAAAAYVASTSYYMLTLPFSLFYQQSGQKLKLQDALTDLRDVMKELQDTIEQTEALKNALGMYPSRYNSAR